MQMHNVRVEYSKGNTDRSIDISNHPPVNGKLILKSQYTQVALEHGCASGWLLACLVGLDSQIKNDNSSETLRAWILSDSCHPPPPFNVCLYLDVHVSVFTPGEVARSCEIELTNTARRNGHNLEWPVKGELPCSPVNIERWLTIGNEL